MPCSLKPLTLKLLISRNQLCSHTRINLHATSYALQASQKPSSCQEVHQGIVQNLRCITIREHAHQKEHAKYMQRRFEKGILAIDPNESMTKEKREKKAVQVTCSKTGFETFHNPPLQSKRETSRLALARRNNLTPAVRLPFPAHSSWNAVAAHSSISP